MLKESKRKKLEKSIQDAHEASEELKAKGGVTNEQMAYALVARDFKEKFRQYVTSLKLNDVEAEKEVLGRMSYAEKTLTAMTLEMLTRKRLERE